MNETWMPVVGYDGYDVSSEGRIRSPRGLLSPTLTGGYYRINLRASGKTKMHLVSRLVAYAFIPNPNLLPQVNHISGVKTDNRAVNLEWCSASGNRVHALLRGLSKGLKGSSNPLSKLTELDVLIIRERLGLGESQASIAKSYAVHQTTIHYIKDNKTWR